MKLLATISEKYAVVSASHHDCRVAPDGAMADGGVPGTNAYAGYTRHSHKAMWIELPGVTMADLINDYSFNKKRKYGIHPIKKVRILPEEEIPDTDSFEWKVENYVWGSCGKHGNEPLRYILLKDAETAHLRAILATQSQISAESKKVIKAILKTRNE